MDDFGIPARVVHRADFAGIQTERLFAHHVLAVLGGGERDRFVREIGRGDDHGVDVRVSANRFVVGRDVVAAPVGAALVEQLAAGVANAGQAGAGIDADGGYVVVVADRAGTDDRDADGIRGGVL